MSNNFEPIIGYKPIIEELKVICDVITNNEKYAKLGANIPKGLLLYGMPGCGKTLMANCFIKETGLKCYTIRKNDSDGKFVRTITDTFKEAKANAPAIIFLDDMDKFANNDYEHLNADEFVTIQSCIDDVKDSKVFVIATANSIRDIPDSMIRVGRFDKKIEVRPPQLSDSVEIINHYLAKKPNVANVDVELIARILEDKSCASLETVINEAAISAGVNNKEIIDMNDIVYACLRVIFDAPIEPGEEDVMDVAYHEAGHILVSEILEPGSVTLASVMQSDSDVGGITSITKNKKYFKAKKFMENRVRIILGGMCATETAMGDYDTGCGNDISRAFRIVERFVDDYCCYGFNAYETGRCNSDSLLYNKETMIANEITRYKHDAMSIIAKNRDFLDKLAHSLAERKTLLAPDIQKIKSECNLTQF